jgi:lysozyme family protein
MADTFLVYTLLALGALQLIWQLVFYIGEKWLTMKIVRQVFDHAKGTQATVVLPAPSVTVTPAPAAPPMLKPAAGSVPPKIPNEYDKMWAAMQILPAHQAVIDRDAAKILQHKADYQVASAQSTVPWFVIGLIDMMEAGGGCDAHLHNGDPLKGRTIHVPAGRPPAPLEPPFTWLQSALDALKFEDFDQIPWGRGTNSLVSTIAAALERYNGMGYHAMGVPSPYLWSFSNQYTKGKFVADHKYDANAVSEQAGAMTILKSLMGQDSSIIL